MIFFDLDGTLLDHDAAERRGAHGSPRGGAHGSACYDARGGATGKRSPGPAPTRLVAEIQLTGTGDRDTSE